MKLLYIFLAPLIAILAIVVGLSIFIQPADRNAALVERLYLHGPDSSYAQALAVADFRDNNFHLLSVGLPDYRPYNHIRDSILKSKYDVEMLYVGCIATEAIFQYSETMTKLLQAKYHHDFYDSATTVAKELAARLPGRKSPYQLPK
jgi:hypothetical protein